MRLNTYRLAPILLIIFFTYFFMNSCGNDDKDSSNKLCDTWQNQAYIYRFDKNGSGYFQYSPTNGLYEVYGDTKSYFKWSTSHNLLFITYDGSGLINAGTTETYYFEVDETLLVLYDIEGGSTNSFTRR